MVKNIMPLNLHEISGLVPLALTTYISESSALQLPPLPPQLGIAGKNFHPADSVAGSDYVYPIIRLIFNTFAKIVDIGRKSALRSDHKFN